MIIAQAQRAAASAERVDEVLATEPAVARPGAPGAAARRATPGARCASRASASATAAGRRCSTASTCAIAPGESVALVGATGSGKTTVARLLPRFYDVDGGRGPPRRRRRARRRGCAELRRAVGIVFEDTFLFSDTIAANIAFADPDAAARRRSSGRPGWPAPTSSSPTCPRATTPRIGERGFSLSGGQRQRIAIARAILADPRVLILDDATSAVDPTKEHEIRDALAEVMHGPHHDRDRPPPGHDRPGRPGRAARRRPGRRRGHPRRAAGHRAPATARCSPPRPTTRTSARPSPTRQRPSRWGVGPDVDAGRRQRRGPPRLAGGPAGPPPHGPDAAPAPPPGARGAAAWSCCGRRRCSPARSSCGTASTRASTPRDAGALNRPSAATWSSPSLAYLANRLQIVLISRVGEELPPRPAHPGVRPPAAAVDAVLRPGEGRACSCRA